MFSRSVKYSPGISSSSRRFSAQNSAFFLTVLSAVITEPSAVAFRGYQKYVAPLDAISLKSFAFFHFKTSSSSHSKLFALLAFVAFKCPSFGYLAVVFIMPFTYIYGIVPSSKEYDKPAFSRLNCITFPRDFCGSFCSTSAFSTIENSSGASSAAPENTAFSLLYGINVTVPLSILPVISVVDEILYFPS